MKCPEFHQQETRPGTAKPTQTTRAALSGSLPAAPGPLLVLQRLLRDRLVELHQAPDQVLPFRMGVQKGLELPGVPEHLFQEGDVRVPEHFAPVDTLFQFQGAREPLLLHPLRQDLHQSRFLVGILHGLPPPLTVLNLPRTRRTAAAACLPGPSWRRQNASAMNLNGYSGA